MRKIEMVDLKNQYLNIKDKIDRKISKSLLTSQFIQGENVKKIERKIKEKLLCNNVISCGNGTDALLLSLLAMDLKKGDEVIIPSFTYGATVEVVAFLGYTPVLIDVDYSTFNINGNLVEEALGSNTKIILPVHLYGQCAEMDSIIKVSKNIPIIEDVAQAFNAQYLLNNQWIYAGNIGNIGCTSFFPSKNLGCYGDGGALMVKDDEQAKKIKMLANHGQSTRYIHDLIGINSRLDEIQACILIEKIKKIDDYTSKRQKAATFYDNALKSITELILPYRNPKSNHVFHQYTLKVKNDKRDQLKEFLQKKGIPTKIYYPIPNHKQNAYKNIIKKTGDLKITEQLCSEILSLPIHTELSKSQLNYICDQVITFFKVK